MDKALPKRLERAETLVDLKLKEQLNEATKNFSDSMTAAIKKGVAETVDAAVQPLNSKADALYDGLSALESRWNNINTRDMAMFIVSQLEAAYPDVRNVQDMLSHFKVQLAHYQGEISRITQLVNNFDARLNRLQTEVSQGDSSDNSRQTIRKELDSLSLDISRIQSAADDAKNQRSADQAKTEELRLEMAKEIGRLRLDIGEKKRPDDTTALPSSLNVPRAGLPRSISASAVSSQLLAERIGPPQPLLHGDGSNKKRKLNGSHSSLGSAETLRAPSRSRRRKRHTFGLGDMREDNSDDSTFEPNQPSISDDAEES
jgi:septal ring factor EnvC (AmiA/AmiB activator)